MTTQEVVSFTKQQMARYHAASWQVRQTLLIDMPCTIEHLIVALETSEARIAQTNDELIKAKARIAELEDWGKACDPWKEDHLPEIERWK